MSQGAQIPFEGVLNCWNDEHDLPDLLLFIGRSAKTGILQFSNPESDKTLHFKNGKIVFAESSSQDDGLGQFLLRTGKISLMDYTRVAKKIRPGKKFGKILVEDKILAPQDLVPAVVGQVRGILLGLFRRTETWYSFKEQELPPSQSVTLDLPVARIILEGVRYVESWRRISKGVGNLDSVYRRSDAKAVEWSRMKLDARVRELLDMMEEPVSLEEICMRAALPDFEACRYLWAFRSLAWIENVNANVNANVDVDLTERAVTESAMPMTPPPEAVITTPAVAPPPPTSVPVEVDGLPQERFVETRISLRREAEAAVRATDLAKLEAKQNSPPANAVAQTQLANDAPTSTPTPTPDQTQLAVEPPAPPQPDQTPFAVAPPAPPQPDQTQLAVEPPAPPQPDQTQFAVAPPAPPQPDQTQFAVAPPAPPQPDQTQFAVAPPAPPQPDQTQFAVAPPAPPQPDQTRFPVAPPAPPRPDQTQFAVAPPAPPQPDQTQFAVEPPAPPQPDQTQLAVAPPAPPQPDQTQFAVAPPAPPQPDQTQFAVAPPAPPQPDQTQFAVAPPAPPQPDQTQFAVAPPAPPQPDQTQFAVAPPAPPQPDQTQFAVAPPAPQRPDLNKLVVKPPPAPARPDQTQLAIEPPTPPPPDQTQLVVEPPAPARPDQTQLVVEPPAPPPSTGELMETILEGGTPAPVTPEAPDDEDDTQFFQMPVIPASSAPTAAPSGFEALAMDPVATKAPTPAEVLTSPSVQAPVLTGIQAQPAPLEAGFMESFAAEPPLETPKVPKPPQIPALDLDPEGIEKVLGDD